MQIAQDDENLVVCEAIPAAPGRVLLIPDGPIKLRSGKSFVLDAQSAATVIAEFKGKGIDTVIDYNHQSLGGEYASPDGRAPAAGWVKDFEYEAGVGLFGRVNWTPSGARRVLNREYRFLSPVVRLDDRGRPKDIDSFGLTNHPNIRNAPALVNSAPRPASPMDTPETPRLPAAAPVTPTRIPPTASSIAKPPRSQAGAAENRPAGYSRQTIINSAGSKWDENPDLDKWGFERRGFIDGELLAAGQAKLTDAEAEEVDPSKRVGGPRQLAICSAMATWIGNPDLVRVCNSARDWVDGQLLEAGHQRLDETEAKELEGSGRAGLVRNRLINSTAAMWDRDPEAEQIVGCSKREFIDGTLLANRQPRITAQELVMLGLR